MKAG
jgi:hypothetical protein